MAPADIHLPFLVLRCQAGDERAFAKLLDAFGPKTLRYLTGLVGDDADDVQQEVWISVYRNIARLENPRAFRTWLFQTTRHRALDALRRMKREAELFARATTEEIDAATAVADGSIDAPMLAESPALDAALATLPVIQREALLLRYRDELSYTEIAAVTGCPIGTVRARLHYAKRELHDILNGEIA